MIFHEQHGYSYTLQREVGPHGVLNNNQSDFQYLDFFFPFGIYGISIGLHTMNNAILDQ
jgi:hypothetical protein